MAYRYGDRQQKTLFPQSIDEYIPQDAPVRAYDVLVDSLDFEQLGIKINPDKVGCPRYNPKAMLKLLVYGYSYGVRSSRKLERETHYNLSFIWLTGGLRPDHKTIAEFRRNNNKPLSKVLRQCARLCIELGLIEGNTLFVDGSRVRANASIKNHWTIDKCRRHLKHIDKRIKEILAECEQADEDEQGQGSLVELADELKGKEQLKSKVKAILDELKDQDKGSTDTTDPDCRAMHSRQGTHAAYNAQSVVDDKHGLIVSCDVVSDNHDTYQFAEQIEQANDTLGHKCRTACADSGYCDTAELEKIDAQQIDVIVPSHRQASGAKPKPFDKSDFRYDSQRDCYICPQGHVLHYRRTELKKRRKIYRIKRSLCRQCQHFGVCTSGKIGRKVTRLLKEELRDKFEAQYQRPEAQAVYERRKQKVELPFGHMKHNLKISGFLLRGIAGPRAEMSLLSTCFNIARMISIMGVNGLTGRLASR